MSAPNARTRLAAAWQARPVRERRLVALAAGLVLLALLWWLALAPALSSLRVATTQRAQLQAQTERMQQLQRQAQALQAMPKIGRAHV